MSGMLPSSNKINIFILSVCLLLFLLIPFKNSIWYDESISVLCSKGINYDTHIQFDKATAISSADITALNNTGNIFKATVMDNSNSYLYNICMHFFTAVYGNSLTAYVLFSRLWGMAALVALFFLARLLFGNNAFVSIAVVLLFADTTFWGMSNEIRAYSMGAFFVTLSALYYFKYTLQKESPVNLLLFGLSAVGAVLTHFFCAYIIAVFALELLIKYRLSLFRKENLLSLFIPVAIVGLYFGMAYTGLSSQNIHTLVVDNGDANSFSLSGMVYRFIKFSAVNFKAVYPRFRDSWSVVVVSFLFIAGIYLYGIRMLAGNAAEKSKYRLLFILGMVSGVFLAIISIKNHTFSSFYYRYFIFSYPFCALFIAMFLKTFREQHKMALTMAVKLLVIVPSVFLFTKGIIHPPATVNYNHMAVAREIVRSNITRIEVPSWDDALLVQSFLPANSNVTFVLNTTGQNFIIYKGNTTEVIPVIRHDS